MGKKLSPKETLAIGLMVFALFFGAGNMIFPPALGQAASSEFWPAVLGFLTTGIGLPLLGIAAIAISNGDLETIAGRVHPKFGLIFTTIVYLSIGPIFAIPRTATVSYEIGVVPFLSDSLKQSHLPLIIYAIIFFAITLILSLNPSKLVDRIGKVLTPLLLLVIAILVFKGIVSPMDTLGKPEGDYAVRPYFKGFIEGYLTMDAIASLVFGIVIINAIKERNVTNPTVIARTTIKAGMISALCLGAVYVSLSYIGATSRAVAPHAQNGGELLTLVATHLYGAFGSAILGAAILFACLTTSVGLVSACGEFFSRIIPFLSYKQIVVIICIFGTFIANLGLSELIAISVPVLNIIYPIAIVLMILTFVHPFFNGYRAVYVGAVIGALMVSIIDGLKGFHVPVDGLTNIYANYLPLYADGVGWITPALIFGFIGFIVALIGKHEPHSLQ